MKTPHDITGIILAAGKGKRMQADLPKVLHQVAGRSMLAHVCASLERIPLNSLCLVLNEQLAPFAEFLAAHPRYSVCLQAEQNGTGGAVASCAPLFSNTRACSYAPSTLHRGQAYAPSHILICAGDSPALEASTLRNFIADSLAKRSKLALMAMKVPDPTGYGRLVVDEDQRLIKIVEEKDASLAEKKLQLVNSGIIFAETEFLFELLQGLSTHNEQREYYLTDCISAAYQSGETPHYFLCPDFRSCLGVNTRAQLDGMEAYMNERKAIK
jgi:bifunctional UDP-N-acetylglucosamine pyrophosphorylase/glucosamine-1-phosphate N-acetyltransferase